MPNETTHWPCPEGRERCAVPGVECECERVIRKQTSDEVRDMESTNLTVERAIMDAHQFHTGRPATGSAVTIAFALGVSLCNAPFPYTGLRHWASILTYAADRMEANADAE